jgi:hypothetical protein
MIEPSHNAVRNTVIFQFMEITTKEVVSPVRIFTNAIGFPRQVRKTQQGQIDSAFLNSPVQPKWTTIKNFFKPNFGNKQKGIEKHRSVSICNFGH